MATVSISQSLIDDLAASLAEPPPGSTGLQGLLTRKRIGVLQSNRRAKVDPETYGRQLQNQEAMEANEKSDRNRGMMDQLFAQADRYQGPSRVPQAKSRYAMGIENQLAALMEPEQQEGLAT